MPATRGQIWRSCCLTVVNHFSADARFRSAEPQSDRKTIRPRRTRRFSEAWISGYESLVPRMTNDEKNVAPAVVCSEAPPHKRKAVFLSCTLNSDAVFLLVGALEDGANFYGSQETSRESDDNAQEWARS